MVPSLYVGFEYASLKVTAVGTELFIKHQVTGLGIYLKSTKRYPLL
jgi:hypothetical protein